MASAEKTTIEKVVKTEEPGYVLELTEDEAKALWSVTMRVGGTPDPERSSRGLIDNIRRALDGAVPERYMEEWAGKFYYSLKGGYGLNARDYPDAED